MFSTSHSLFFPLRLFLGYEIILFRTFHSNERLVCFMKKICVITDNLFLYKEFLKIIVNTNRVFEFYCSSKDSIENLRILNLKQVDREFLNQYDLFISLHCKQIFPDFIVDNYRCVNFHPGFNPYNRGWFPHVFSIINGYPIGVTIHEMDKEIDGGGIIAQKTLDIFDYETSDDVYHRILELEIQMIKENIVRIIDNSYITKRIQNKGNINYKKDFAELCNIDLLQMGTFGEFINILRATTFHGYDNAYFYDQNGEKIYVSIRLKKENNK